MRVRYLRARVGPMVPPPVGWLSGSRTMASRVRRHARPIRSENDEHSELRSYINVGNARDAEGHRDKHRKKNM